MLFWHVFCVHVQIHQPWNWGYCLSPIVWPDLDSRMPWEIPCLKSKIPFQELTSTDINWEPLQTYNSTYPNASESMYFKSTSIKDKAINSTLGVPSLISHELNLRILALSWQQEYKEIQLSCRSYVMILRPLFRICEFESGVCLSQKVVVISLTKTKSCLDVWCHPRELWSKTHGSDCFIPRASNHHQVYPNCC